MDTPANGAGLPTSDTEILELEWVFQAWRFVAGMMGPMKLINDFLERGAHFQRLAAKEANPKFKALLEKNANEYFKLAEKRAEELGLPAPQRPEISD